MSVILNIVLAIIALVFFFKFVRLKKLSESEFDNYEEKLEEEISKRKDVELKYKSEAHYLANLSPENKQNIKKENPDPIKNEDENDVIKSMQQELENLHKEKEQELLLRLETQKQLELALQKTHDVEKRVEDWHKLHAENLENVSKAIEDCSLDLYHKLIEALGEKFKNHKDNSSKTLINNEEDIKKLEEILKSIGLVAKNNYFMNYMIPESSRKSVPCDAFIIFSDETCVIIDIKAIKFLSEFAAKKDDQMLKSKIDRYFAYLTNPKYRANVVNYFAAQKLIAPKANSTLVMLLNSSDEVEKVKKLDENYSAILQKSQIHLHSFDSVKDLIKSS